MTTQSPTSASPAVVLVAGLLAIVVAIAVVLTAVALGWIAALAMGVALLVMARQLRPDPGVEPIRVIVAGLGTLSIFGAVFSLIS